MAKRALSHLTRPIHLAAVGVFIVSAAGGAAPAAAQTASQEKVYFTAVENAQRVILEKINAETVRVDVATWMLVDGDIVAALIRKHQSGVPVRVIGDRITIFEQGDKNTHNSFMDLARAGVPIRVRRHPTWFPEIMHWKSGIFVGQGIVEFGSANWTTFELMPWTATDFKDETAMFTDDQAIFNAFLTQFDKYWVDTQYFEDWDVAYKAETQQDWNNPVKMNISRTRLADDFETNIPGMIWSQGSELINAMLAEINAETTGIDMVSYRLTMPNIVDALIAKHQAGVKVRVFIEPTQYRNPGFPEFWLVGAMTDRLWLAGIPIKQRTHQGLTHMKSLITSRSSLVASANFTKNWQRDHNYFISATQKPQLHLAHKDRFNAMWNDTTHYTTFRPLRPIEPQIPLPGKGAVNVATTTRLEWNRAPFATSFDVYLGPAGSAMAHIGRVDAVVTDNPPATYSIAPPQALQPNTTYNWRVVSRTYASDVDPSTMMGSDVWSFTTGGSTGGGGSPGSGPFNGTPLALPGTIQAENFDNGGSNVGYFDTTSGNSGGQYRPSEHVDIEATSDTGGGYNVGWVGAGEWLHYTVNVATAGTYTLEFRVASAGAGGTFHLEVNGVNKTGPLTVPSTGSWQTWTTVVKTGVSLAAGQQVWRLVFDSSSSSGAIGNVNYVRVVSGGSAGDPTPTTATPYGGTRAALPGTLQAENFDEGGIGVAYQDTSAGNSGGQYRTTDVDVEGTSDVGGGYNIGWMAAGEWLNYSVNVTAAGTYTIEFRVAAAAAGGTFHLEVNGVDKTGPLTIPNTGGWQNWATVSKSGVSLNAGNQAWRLVIDRAGAVVGNLNHIRVVAGSTGGGGTPTATPYGGTPASLPGTLQAEHFDEGGANLGYVDNSGGNSGGAFRATDVDIESSVDTGGGYNLGWVGAGEWLQYTVNVAAAGTYTLEFRVASLGAGGTFRLEVNGVDKTGTLSVPSTGDWQTWTTVRKTGVSLAAGQQVWRLVMVGNSATTGGVGNFNWIRVVSGSASLLQPERVHAGIMPHVDVAPWTAVLQADAPASLAVVAPRLVPVRADRRDSGNPRSSAGSLLAAAVSRAWFSIRPDHRPLRPEVSSRQLVA